MDVSVVVPVYNSEKLLPDLVARLQPVLAANRGRYELILVNDGSRDRSWDLIRSLAREHPWIRGFNLMRNYGQHRALTAGIMAARHECIVTMDDDLQNPPEEIPRLLAELGRGYDLVYGVPEKKSHAFWRNAASGMIRVALRGIAGAEIARSASSFRALRSGLKETLAACRSPFVPIDVPLAWATARMSAVTVRHHPRSDRRSTYRLGTLIFQAVNTITGFSVLPLKIASGIGFVFTVVGMGVLAYAVGRRLILGYSMPGFPFLASAIALFSGAQLFALGVIGEYLSRLYLQSLGMPGSIVRERTDQPDGIRP